MAKRGGRKTAARLRKTVKSRKKPSKASRKTKTRRVKAHPKVSRQKTARRPRQVQQPEVVFEETRVLEKLPPAKPLRLERQVVRVFGHKIDPSKVKNAAVEAYSKRGYGIDDIPVGDFIRDSEWDNLMTKIGILDRIEEQLNLMYPHIDVVRKNKITLELYLSK